MKKITFFFLLFSLLSFTQNKKADAILNEINKVSTDSLRCRLTLQLLLYTNDLSQQEKINYSKKILKIAKNKDDHVLESIITSSLAFISHNNGNTLQATELCYQALEIAEKENNDFAKGFCYTVLALCNDSGDITKTRKYLFKSLYYCNKSNDDIITSAVYKNISDTYFSEKYKDSALLYAQKANQLSIKNKQQYIENFSLISLGNIHYYLMKDKEIGYIYMRKALNTKYTKTNAEANLHANLAIANFFKEDSKLDSALYYTNKAFVRKDKIPYTASLFVYRMYKKIYAKTNSDSAVKYFQLYENVKDSIKKMSNVEQQQLLSIKKELDIENIEHKRKLKIQYTFIGIGILFLFTIYLLLSRSFIINSKMVKFFGIVGLLIVFEFINLIVHPFLERITHHNAILMLLALVAIAALLVPLHHKIEHWATNKMVEKNKQIRIEHAKKIIEKLEDKS